MTIESKKTIQYSIPLSVGGMITFKVSYRKLSKAYQVDRYCIFFYKNHYGQCK
jgi:hypothetical protein